MDVAGADFSQDDQNNQQQIPAAGGHGIEADNDLTAEAGGARTIPSTAAG
jgi:hypothetical protein